MFRQKWQELPDVWPFQWQIRDVMIAILANEARTTLEHCFVRIGRHFHVVLHFLEIIRHERGRFGWECLLDRLLEFRVVLAFNN